MLALASLLALGSGCDDDTSSGGSGGDGGDGGSGGEGGSAGGNGGGGAGGEEGGGGSGGGEPTTVIYGAASSEGQPLEEGDVCFIAEAIELCTELGIQGGYFIDHVPLLTQGALRFRAPSIPITYLTFRTGDENYYYPGLVSNAQLDSLYDAAQLTRTPTSAAVFVFGASGAVAVLSPPSGQGPFYLSPSIDIDPAATVTTDAGIALFLDVDRADGPFTAHLEVDGMVCDLAFHGLELTEPWQIPDDAEQVGVQARCPEPGEEGGLP